MWMWWQSLTVLEQVLCCVAVPATVVLAIQTVLLLIGLGGQDGDGEDGGAGDDLDHADAPEDAGGHGDHLWEGHGGCGDESCALCHPGDGLHLDLDLSEVPPPEAPPLEGLNLFSLRGIVALLTVFGWGSLALLQLGLFPPLALALGAVLGVGAMFAVALILREALRFQESGTLDYRNTLGLTGTVYLTVPPLRQGAGKVNLTVQEQLREFDAVTDFGERLVTGDLVTVVGVTRGGAMVVEPAAGDAGGGDTVR